MDEILKWLGGLSGEAAGSGLFSVLVTAVVAGAVKGWRESKRATERMQSVRPTLPVGSAVDEPDTRKIPLPELPPGGADVEFWQQQQYTRCRKELDNAQEALRGAAKLADARERALERANAELQADLDAVRGDLVVARNTVLKLEAAGADLARQLRQAHGLESDAPPAPRTPGSALTVTRRPPRS